MQQLAGTKRFSTIAVTAAQIERVDSLRITSGDVGGPTP
jgi:hypothetical protein